MNTDLPSSCHCRPLVAQNAPDVCLVEDDPQLIAEGWTRRHLIDRRRAQESIDLYTAIGYEVKTKAIAIEKISPICHACVVTILHSHVLIYTRKIDSRSR